MEMVGLAICGKNNINLQDLDNLDGELKVFSQYIFALELVGISKIILTILLKNNGLGNFQCA